MVYTPVPEDLTDPDKGQGRDEDAPAGEENPTYEAPPEKKEGFEAVLYERLPGDSVRCFLCRHGCTIPPGKRGICGVRENREGILISLVYERCVAKNIDPIEKKPLFHVLPGSRSFSIATVGCNFKCRFCQNSGIAQMPSDQNGLIVGDYYPPGDVVADALDAGCQSISYTYTEPTVYFEYAYAIARIAKEKGLKNIFVTNGYQSPECIKMMAPFLDAANVDLKSFNRKFYTGLVGAQLDGVLENLKLFRKEGVFLEITTLLIPKANDDPREIKALAEFIVRELGPDTPWHVSRFHPSYRLMDRQPTDPTALFQARNIGRDAGLRYVYTGNIPGHGGENTQCHKCKALLIERSGFTVKQNRMKDGVCPDCFTSVSGIWD